MGLVNLLFGFKGRINRMQYWLGTLGAGFAGGFVIFAIAFSAISMTAAAPKDSAAQGGLTLVLVIGVVMMALSWIGLALQWKRFHDRGRPGWVAFAPLLPMTMIFITVVNGALTGAPVNHVLAAANGWMMLLWAINLAFFIDLGCLAGQEGPNQYGDPPGSGSSYTPAPQAPSGAPAAASALFGAQSAMDRAIAEQQTKPAAARPSAAAPRPAMSAGPAPAGGAPSFGRRPQRA